MADGDLIIDLDVPEIPTADKVVAKAKEAKIEAAPAAPDAPVLTQEAFDTLKKQLDDEKRSREDAVARAQRAEGSTRKAYDDAAKSQNDARAAELTMVSSAIESVKREQEVLEANYANALSAQDFTAAAKLQSSMSSNAARLVQLETGKQAMEEEAKRAEERAKAAPQRPTVDTTDPVEALAAQLSPRSADWVRKHPEYARDQRLMRKMIAAHNLVVDEHPADSDAYFTEVEKVLGIAPKVEDAPALSEAAKPAAPRSSAPAAAPVSRSGSTPGQRPNTVTLTKEEREIAEMNGMSPREYAEQKAKLIKEGRMN